MRIRRIAIGRINSAPYNPRVDLKSGDPEYESLKRSLKEFGLVEPLVWNRRTGNLVGGHQRLAVLKNQRVHDVDVVEVDLPPEKEKALNIALNKIQGRWDQEKLARLLDELVNIPDFDIGVTGFDLPDAQTLIDEVLGSALAEKDETFDVEAALAEEGPAVTQPGEAIDLGRHRLLCGDSSKAPDVQKAAAGRRVNLLFTDPPYNVSYYGGNRPAPDKARPKPSRQWKRIYGDNLTQREYVRWLGRVMGNVKAVLAPGAPLYIWNGHRQFGPMHQMLEGLGFKVSCVITWAKESFAIGHGDYNQQTEFCLYGWREDNGAHHWYGPTNESTLWQVHRDATKNYVHPTQKPLELAERAIRNSTRRGETVLDCFLGSGTTLIACERKGRRCVGLEIDPHYCDVIIRRYIAFAGEDRVPGDLVRRYRAAEAVVK